MTSNDTTFDTAPRTTSRLGLAHIQRVFENLAQLARARAERRAQLGSQRPTAQTRSEAFKQVQHEKWLGTRAITKTEQANPRPRDMYKRILQDPNG